MVVVDNKYKIYQPRIKENGPLEILINKKSINKSNFNYLFKKKLDHLLVPHLIRDVEITQDSESIFLLGRILIDHTSEFYDLKTGVKYITLASKKYNHKGATCIRAMWAINLKERKKLYKKAANNKSYFAIIWLAKYYYYNKNKKQKGIDLFKLAADNNKIDALNQLGHIYHKNKKYNVSFEYYLRSHNLGNIIGTKNVGLALIKGHGTVQDRTKGQELVNAYWLQTKDPTVQTQLL